MYGFMGFKSSFLSKFCAKHKYIWKHSVFQGVVRDWSKLGFVSGW